MSPNGTVSKIGRDTLDTGSHRRYWSDLMDTGFHPFLISLTETMTVFACTVLPLSLLPDFIPVFPELSNYTKWRRYVMLKN